MKNSLLFSLAVSFFLSASAHAYADRDRALPDQQTLDTQKFLEEFDRDPKRVMNTLPRKFDDQGNEVPKDWSAFGEPLEKAEMLRARNLTREKICKASGQDCDGSRMGHSRSRSRSHFSTFSQRNQIEDFLFQTDYIRNLAEMERSNLLTMTMVSPPWSDSFWPMNKGKIARRWMDKTFPDRANWAENFTYVQMAPPWMMDVNVLSPAEKYDVLVGDGSFGMSAKMWNEGKWYIDNGRKVPGWSGLCHGWAPASIMAPNPMKAVTVISAGGQPITFYPSDLKALASLAWGEIAPAPKQVGRRCNVTDPKEDSVGRVLNEDCFDVNPGTWHMAIVNQLGKYRRSFVFDATYDTQVWNYPINGYKYIYFNPQTKVVSTKLAGSMARIIDFTSDKFKSHRAPDAKFVVGIAMDVQYAIPTQPSSKPSTKSKFHEVKYVYDLEIDGQGNIVGGEWYSNFHPDFIWNLPPDGVTRADAEKSLPPLSWDGRSSLPPEFQQAAVASSPKGHPLGSIVDALIQLSNPKPPPQPPAPPTVPPVPAPAGPAPTLPMPMIGVGGST